MVFLITQRMPCQNSVLYKPIGLQFIICAIPPWHFNVWQYQSTSVELLCTEDAVIEMLLSLDIKKANGQDGKSYGLCSLIPRPLPDFISQPWIFSRGFFHGCEIKSGRGLGTRLWAMFINLVLQNKHVYNTERFILHSSPTFCVLHASTPTLQPSISILLYLILTAWWIG